MAYDAYSATAPVEHPALTKQRLRSSLCRLIDKLVTALDDIDGDPDVEDGADDEPSLSFTGHLNQDAAIRGEPMGLAAERGEFDLEQACEDEGAQCDDEGCEDENREASLSGSLGTYTHAVGPGETGFGSLGEISWDLEDQCEDEGHDSDREPEVGQ